MSFNNETRNRIKTYLAEKIELDDSFVISKVADAFGISQTSVKRYIDDMLAEGIIEGNSSNKSGYAIVNSISRFSYDFCKGKDTEEKMFYTEVFPVLNHLPENIKRLWTYSCLELLNNAIEHSRGDMVHVVVSYNRLYTDVFIYDNGVGVLQTIVEKLREQEKSADYLDAYTELVKGKFTSDPENHSGEGIFFSSRFADRFVMAANGYVMNRNSEGFESIFHHRLLSYAMFGAGVGTLIMLRINNYTKRTPKEVFDMYSTLEDGITKAEIAIKPLCQYGEPVARSQAKRISGRLTEFREVVFDFTDIDFMGQGFADEMFRVFPRNNPELKISVRNANADIEKMLRHVGFAP